MSGIINDEVIDRLVARHMRRAELGMIRFGKPISERPATTEQMLREALEEAMDMCVYLEKALYDLEKEKRQCLNH